MHLVLPELLEAHGYKETPANRATLIRSFRELLPDTPLHLVDDPDKDS